MLVGLWFALAFGQGHGRRLAFKVLFVWERPAPSRAETGEELDVLGEVPVAEEVVLDPGVGGGAEAVGERRVVEQADHRRGEPRRGRRGRSARRRGRATIWSWIPPTRLATTGRAFHIASVTVSPNPSTRLFCTTM